MCIVRKLEPFELVRRDKWGALPAKQVDPPLELPVPHVIVTFTSGTELGETQEDCIRIMKDLQKRHMDEEGMTDIAYNFVIGGDGRVYEGRGWTSKPSNPKYPEYRHGRVDIAYMGDLDRSELNWTMFKPCIQLINAAVDSKIIMPEYNVVEDPQTLTMINQDD